MLTWATLKSEILAEDDLSEEVFVSPTELISFANDALRTIEKDIHAIGGQKYFEDYVDTPLVFDKFDYTLPTNIYAFKITAIHYINNEYGYEVRPITKKERLLDYEDPSYRDNLYLRYKFYNTPVLLDITGAYIGGGPKIRLYPKPLGTGFIRIYYIRSVSKIVDDNSIVEIPEGQEFLKAYIIEKALNKERLNQDAAESPGVAQKRTQLIESLTTMFADDNNEIEADYSFYNMHE